MHICSFVLCSVIVLQALIHLTEFALNEGNWQVGRQNPNVAKSPIKETARGKTDPETGVRKNDIMMPGKLKAHFDLYLVNNFILIYNFICF